MVESWIQIGELRISVTSTSSEAMGWLETYCLPDSRDIPPDLNWHVEWGYGIPFTSFQVDITTEVNRIEYNRRDYQIVVDADYKNATIRVHDGFALKHALMNLYSAVIVYRGWGLLIHSSCVIRGDEAFIFAGHSGAGKSTVARLSKPRPLLSDEATIVKVSESGVLVYNSPFRSDTVPDAIVGPYHLKAVHVIHQASYVERRIKRKTDGIYALMDKVFFWSHDPVETAKILRLYEILVSRVSVYDLHFTRDATFWEAIS
ncbi:hypothetical protein [Alicyclobacillus mengziensis]|uniref:Uncharacterized protein n=1 Tax=Alicyclobacillus mengziensis TaxID=2931921 RepID=A0A9X7VUH5_9BACL|nr:hypothetical protein [Alicyclobacillus mengziensis]QSO45459.1 hypothetical protein JZ786_12820 [Alicyclobacillus mengziensis]